MRWCRVFVSGCVAGSASDQQRHGSVEPFPLAAGEAFGGGREPLGNSPAASVSEMRCVRLRSQFALVHHHTLKQQAAL